MKKQTDDNFKKKLDQNFEKYGIVIMALALFAIIIIRPILAHAECEHGDWGKAKHSEFFDNRMKALHEDLKLSDSQQSAWDDFSQQLKPNEQAPKPDRSELSKLPTPERLDRMLSRMKERQQKMESHVQAIKSFYTQLSPEQQKIFDESFRPHRGDHEKY